MSVSVRLMDGPCAGQVHRFDKHPGHAIVLPRMPEPGECSQIRYDLQPPMAWEAQTYGGRLHEMTLQVSPELFVTAHDARYVVDETEKQIRAALFQHGCTGPTHMRWWAEVTSIHSNWEPTRIPWDRSRPRELPDRTRMIGCTGTAREAAAPSPID